MYRGRKRKKQSHWKKLLGLPSPVRSAWTATQQMFNTGHSQSTYCSPRHFPPPVGSSSLPHSCFVRQLHTRNIRLLTRPHLVHTWQGHPALTSPAPVLPEQINFSHHLCSLFALSKDMHGLKNKFTHRLEGKGHQRNSITSSLRTAALEEVGCLRCFKAQVALGWDLSSEHITAWKQRGTSAWSRLSWLPFPMAASKSLSSAWGLPAPLWPQGRNLQHSHLAAATHKHCFPLLPPSLNYFSSSWALSVYL